MKASRIFLAVMVGLALGVVSRLLYLRLPQWRGLLNSIGPRDYSLGGVFSGFLASIDPGVSGLLASLATSYECGEGLLGDNPLHELAWYLPYYAVSLALALGFRKTILIHAARH
jgi:NhaP-type Na+/H+ or K+/H+ antiporter